MFRMFEYKTYLRAKKNSTYYVICIFCAIYALRLIGICVKEDGQLMVLRFNRILQRGGGSGGGWRSNIMPSYFFPFYC